MASCIDNTYRVTATWNAVARNDCVGGSVQRTCEFIEVTPGTRITPCRALNKLGVEVDIDYQDLMTPATTATRASVVFTLTKLDITPGTKTITIVNCRAGNDRIDMSSQPHRQTSTFVHDPQGTEDLAPITVA